MTSVRSLPLISFHGLSRAQSTGGSAKQPPLHESLQARAQQEPAMLSGFACHGHAAAPAPWPRSMSAPTSPPSDHSLSAWQVPPLNQVGLIAELLLGSVSRCQVAVVKRCPSRCCKSLQSTPWVGAFRKLPSIRWTGARLHAPGSV